MKRLLKIMAPVALAMAVGGCSLGSLLGGGGKVPPTLLTLTPQAPAPAEMTRSASAGEAVTIETPVTPEALRTVRIPAYLQPNDVAYVENAQWVDTPAKLFQDLVAETIRRTTNRVVLDPNQSTLDPGLVVTGHLQRFGYDESAAAVVVRYDAALSTAGGTRVETRRFEAQLPADGTAATVGPQLNQAANQVATAVAAWIGS